MSGDAWIVVSISGAYLLACLIVGTLPARSASASATGYVAGDRSLGLVVMYFITGATIFSAFAFLGGPGWAYSRGVSVLYILGYGALGFLPFYFLGPRAARVGRAFGFVTQAEMVAARFQSRWLAGLMALISLIGLIPYLAVQMKGAGYVVETVTSGKVPAAGGAAVVYGVVLLYVLASGVLGVGWTNTFQGVFMMLLAWGLGLYLPYKLHGGVTAMFEQIARARPELLDPPGLGSDLRPWPWGEYASAVIVSVVGFCAWPHLFMKAFSASSLRTIRRTVVLYPTFQLFLIPLFLIGFAGVLYPSRPEDSDQILPHLLMHMDISPVLVGLFCAGALAASMSSGDAMAHAAASIAVRDGLVAAGGRTIAPPVERRLIRLAVVAVLLLSYLVAVLYQGSLVTLLLSAYGAVVQFMPALVAALYWRRVPTAAVFSGMLLGSGVTLGFVVAPGARPFEVHAGLYGLVVNLVVLTLWTLARPVRGPSKFLDVAVGGGPRERTGRARRADTP